MLKHELKKSVIINIILDQIKIVMSTTH